jgi:integrase
MRKNAGRLFFEVRYGADGVPSTVFSKWFARFLDKLGLTDPTIVFHSFRHSAEDAFRNAALPQYQIDRIIGHSDDSTSAGYGEGISLDTAYAAVKAMKLKADLPALWKRAG